MKLTMHVLKIRTNYAVQMIDSQVAKYFPV